MGPTSATSPSTYYACRTTSDGKTKVIAMQLMGINLSELRKRQPGGLMPFGACLHIGLQMLACIEAVHQEGYVHRDIKVSLCTHMCY
jgi:serine/threonine protein kinase